MSRTTKDRPYWVRSNDPKEERVAHHNHFFFGRKYYKTVKVLDEKGQPTYTKHQHALPALYLVHGINFSLRSKEDIYSFISYSELFKAERYFQTELSMAERFTIINRAKRLHSSGQSHTLVPFGKAELRLVTKQVLLATSSTGCSIENRLTEREYQAGQYSRLMPCFYVLDLHHSRNRPRKDERKGYHASYRAKESSDLGKLTKMHNSGEDLDDVDASDTLNFSRTTRYKGWW